MNEAQIQFLASKGKINNAQADFLRSKYNLSAPQQVQAQPEQMGITEQATRMVFPRLSEASPDSPLTQRLGKSFQDLLSLPGRVGATYGGQAINALRGQPTDFRSLPEQIQQTGSQESVVGNIVRQPSTLPSFAVPISKIPQGASLLAKSGILAAQGAKVGGVVGGIDQLQNVSEGKNIQPLEVGKEAAFGAALNPALGGVLSVLAKAPGATAKGLAALSQKLSTPGEFKKVQPALQAFGWGKGKGAQAIIENAGKEAEIGSKLVESAERIAKGEIQNKAIKEAVQKMPEINVKSTVETIKKQMYSPKDFGGSLEPWQIRINQELKDIAGRLSAGEKMTAEQFLNKRKVIDKGINFDAEGYDVAAEFANKMQKVRENMKNELIDAAYYSGNDDYVKAMKQWSENIGASQALLKGLGGGQLKANPESAIANLFGKNKTQLQKNVRKIEELTGEQFIDPAKYANYAKILGMESGSKAPVAMTQLTTGLGAVPAYGAIQALLNNGGVTPLIAGTGAMVLGSPRVAAGLASTAKALERPTKTGAARALMSAQKVLPALRAGNLSQQEENR